MRSLPVLLTCAFVAFSPALSAHDAGGGHPKHTAVTAVPLPFVVEKTGPVRAPKAVKLEPGTKVSGQGFWKFIAAPDLVPVPPAAVPFVKGAHGTVIFDAKNDSVYWGLKDVGFVGFSNKLSRSWIVEGDPVLKKGNLHGADIFPRKGKPALVAAADNDDGQIHLTDTTFQHSENLGMPPFAQYADKKGYAPTDVAIQDAGHLWITDGYGKAFFMGAETSPLRYSGKIHGGKAMSQTPHGISFDPRTGSLLISARPEGRIMDWDMKHERFQAIDGLPPGSTICNMDIWGDHALAPCLSDTDKTKAGPIFIVNLKKHAVVATIRPRDDLGYADVQSVHGACWYVSGTGSKREVYIVFTAWNPGGIGALKLVNIAD